MPTSSWPRVRSTVWTSQEDFECYWYSEEITAAREEMFNYFGKPVSPTWHSLVGSD